ncbi:MAG: Gfo/Idh/MocA family oxidoreductase [Thermodesulfobacteriota bacterium]|nr:Gfo/Idh/MocA family oxidoreductase [Thermodesulfobacteriota bacterium]
MKASIAVVGAGHWGKNLVRNFYELGVLHTICDLNRDLGSKYNAQYPDIKFTDSFNKVLNDSQVNAVVIATPASFHGQMVREALYAEKHVLVEKPIALKLEDGKDLVALAMRKGVVLMVGHILQYHPAIEKLIEIINKGELGKIQYIYSNRLNIGKIRFEENILWSFAPHDISIILSLLNETPKTVCATGGSYLQHQIPDVTVTTMDFRSGVKAHIFVSWLHPFKEQKLVVVGDKKMAVFDDISKEKLFLYPHRIEWVERIPVACKAEAEIINIKMEEPLKAECKHFLQCTENNEKPKTDGGEGLRVLQILQACQESLSNSGIKIELKELDEQRRQEYFVHKSSYIDEDVEIGGRTRIWHFSHIMKGCKIGKDCRIGQNVVIGRNVIIGNGCKIQNNVSVYEGVTLEDGVFCGPSMVFTNVFNPRAKIPRMDEIRPTLVKEGATIGANATVICGNTIGRYAFIGAGALITRDVPDYALITGSPGGISAWMCECGIRLDFNGNEGKCPECKKLYIREKNKVKPCN